MSAMVSMKSGALTPALGQKGNALAQSHLEVQLSPLRLLHRPQDKLPEEGKLLLGPAVWLQGC